MNTLLEFLPIIAFFAAFKLIGGAEAIYPATAVGIGVAVLVTGVHWLRHRHVPGRQLMMLGVFIVMGGFTLAFHDPRFIQAKPTIVSLITAAVFLVSQFVGQKTLVERAFTGSVQVAPAVWRRLNLAWVAFFTGLAALNHYVAANFSMDIWVDFKLFGILGLTVVFALAQGYYLMRHDQTPPDAANDP